MRILQLHGVIGQEHIIDLVSYMDYIVLGDTLPSFPIIFSVHNQKDETILGKGGYDKDENFVIYANGKIVFKKDPDILSYREIKKAMKKHFNLNEESEIMLKKGSFSGKFFSIDKRFETKG